VTSVAPILSVEEAHRLDRLVLAARAGAPSIVPGRRAAPWRGSGLEFHDVRPYQPGDDPRLIDWTIDARLRKLVVRVHRSEGQVRLHLLLDASASMGCGAPDKLACAKKAAAALSYVAAARRDAFGLAAFDAAVRSHVAPRPGRAHLFRVLDALRSTRSTGASNIDAALSGYAAAVRGPGLAVVLSDFFQPDWRGDGLKYLAYRGFDVVVVQILADEEVDPAGAISNETEELEIVDAEHADAAPLVADASAAEASRRAVERLAADLERWCQASGMAYVSVRSSTPFGALLEACTRAGLLRAYA
jgi:uncharacterized protein (DUF58 family)